MSKPVDNPARRQALALIGTVALSSVAMGSELLAAAPDPHMSNAISVPRTTLPALACDCQVHVFDPARFPYTPERSYTPAPATVADLLRFENLLGAERMVLVQPSVYGIDNRCLVDALGAIGSHRARGIAVVDLHSVTDSELDRLHAAGVRGIRLNLEVKGESRTAAAVELLRIAERRLARRNWTVQLYADLALVLQLADTLRSLKIRVMLDHFAGAKAATDTAVALEQLGGLIEEGNVFVKLSAPYRASKLAPTYHDLQSIAASLLGRNPRALVWGTDWPHTGSSGARSGDLSQIEPFRIEDDGKTAEVLSGWISDARLRSLVFSENAAAFYDFAAPTRPR